MFFLYNSPLDCKYFFAFVTHPSFEKSIPEFFIRLFNISIFLDIKKS